MSRQNQIEVKYMGVTCDKKLDIKTGLPTILVTISKKNSYFQAGLILVCLRPKQ